MKTLLAALIVLAATACTAPASSTCEPACRAGFVCVRGACVPACNPACPAGETCTAAGTCVRDTMVDVVSPDGMIAVPDAPSNDAGASTLPMSSTAPRPIPLSEGCEMLNFVISDRLTIAPNDTTWMITRCLVAGGIWQIRVFRTLDGGQNWEPPTMPPLPTTPRDFSGELTYAIHAIDDQTVIVGYRNNAETTFSTSTDAGRTWNAAVVVRENGNFVTPTLSISHNGPIVYATMSMSANQGTTYRGANNGMGPWTMAQNSLQGSRSRVLVSGTGPTARLTVISNATGTSIQVATDGDPLILAAPQVLSAVRTTTVDWELRGETLFITSRSPDAYRLPLAMPDLAQSLAYNTGGSGSERAVTSDSAGNFYTFGLALAGPAYRNSVQRIPAGPVAMAETPIFSYPEPGDIAAYNRRTGALIVVVRDSTPPNPLLSAFIQY